MSYYEVCRVIEKKGKFSPKAAEVLRKFGLSSDRLEKLNYKVKCELKIEQGDVILITGPSGSGKSTLMNLLSEQFPADEQISTSQINPPRHARAIDVVDADVKTSIEYLCRAGLSDVVSIVNQYKHLSEGQKWRCKLAAALAANKKVIFADEFCSNLDRLAASVICENIRKFADHYKVTFILASCSEEKLTDLGADAVVLLDSLGVCSVISKYDGYYHIRNAINRCMMTL